MVIQVVTTASVLDSIESSTMYSIEDDVHADALNTGSGSHSPSTASISSSSQTTATGVNFVPITHIPPLLKKKNGATSTIEDTKVKKEITVNDASNHSRESLSEEGSEREPVVYLPDQSGYHNRPSQVPQPPPPYGDLESWRPDPWDRDYNRRLRFNTTRVQHIEAECQDDYMKIRIGFNGSFAGLLYSAGYAYDPDCMYINGSGRDYYEFYIQLNRCGTLGKNAQHDDARRNPTKNFMWNTITVQYNPLIEEEFDEHFKVTCEYGYDFWKTVTFPFLDVEVATGNPVVFTLSPPECYMEIRNGYGIGGTRVTGPVRVGDPLTLIIYMRSKYDGFDIVVNDCYAHNGANKKIQLIDNYGCPVDDKLISRFRGTWSESGVFETQVYAYMKTFRFTGSPALYIECDVRMCHGRCPSQPCHWRNLKAVTKREISNQTLEGLNEKKEPPALSDNINLFQSLRVLQEDEVDENEVKEPKKQKDSNETCMKTTIMSGILGSSCLVLSILLGTLLITCTKLRHRKKDSSFYDAYVNHKGQID